MRKENVYEEIGIISGIHGSSPFGHKEVIKQNVGYQMVPVEEPLPLGNFALPWGRMSRADRMRYLQQFNRKLASARKRHEAGDYSGGAGQGRYER